MQMKDIIRKKRRECGYTQEQVAAYLGVSAPAVNKWESGATFPDVALLSPLARLLKTDLNTLLCFRENLTLEDIVSYVAEVSEIARKTSVDSAVERIRELVKEYPSCVELMHQMASLLTGLSIIVPCTAEQQERNTAVAVELFERVAESDDPAYANRARYMLASRLIQEEEYDRAGQLIDKIPTYDGLDKGQLQISMEMKKKNAGAAGKLLEQKINQLLQEVFLQLNQLATVAVWENDRDRAWALAEYAQQVMGIYGWDYSKYTVAFSVAVEEKDAEKCRELLEVMMDSLEKPVDLSESILYTHLRKKDDETQSKENNHNEPEIDGTQDGEGRNGGNEMTQQMKSALLAALEKDEKFAFLREKYGDIGKWFEKV